jgi:hypothetical protein
MLMPVWRNRLLRIFPAGNALYDGASMTMAAFALLSDENVTDTPFFILMAGVGLFSLMQSYVLCADETVEGIEDTLEIISTRRKPQEWVHLSRNKEILAVSSATVISLCAVSSDFFGGWYFVGGIPVDYEFENQINMRAWAMLSVPTGIISGITTFFTEGKGVFHNVRRILAGQPNEYKTSLGKYLCYFIGYPIAIIGNLEAVCEANSTMTDLISPETLAGRYGVLMCSAPKGISDFFFSGKFAIEAIDNFTARMLETSERAITRQEASAFFISLMVAALVEFPQPFLTFKLLDDTETQMPFTIPPVLQYILGYGVSVRDGLVLMVTLFPLFLLMVNRVEKKFSDCFSRAESSDDTTPYVTLNGSIDAYLPPDDPFLTSTHEEQPPAPVPSLAWPSFWRHRTGQLLTESELTRTTESMHSSPGQDREVIEGDFDEEYEEKLQVVYRP